MPICHLPPSLLPQGPESCTLLDLFCRLQGPRMIWHRYNLLSVSLSSTFFSCFPVSVTDYTPHPDHSIPSSFVCDPACLLHRIRPVWGHFWGCMTWTDHRSPGCQNPGFLLPGCVISVNWLNISALGKSSSNTTSEEFWGNEMRQCT